jgi:ketosteroid isomerase-like protein
MRQVVEEYIRRINDHDVDGIIDLMHADFQFVNSAGDKFKGRGFMRQEWRKQFERYPDFHIHVDHVMESSEGVGIFGSAEGTYEAPGEDPDENHWLVPAAWFGVVRDGKIVLWQVFGDSSVVLEIVREHEENAPGDE